MEKHEALGSAVAQIERQFGKGAIMKMGDQPVTEVAAVPTGALALDGCPVHQPEFFLRGTEPLETCPQWRAAPPPVTVGQAPAPRGQQAPPSRREREDDSPGLLERFRRCLER